MLISSEYLCPIRFIISESHSPKYQTVTNTEKFSPDLKAEPYMENLSSPDPDSDANADIHYLHIVNIIHLMHQVHFRILRQVTRRTGAIASFGATAECRQLLHILLPCGCVNEHTCIHSCSDIWEVRNALQRIKYSSAAKSTAWGFAEYTFPRLMPPGAYDAFQYTVD